MFGTNNMCYSFSTLMNFSISTPNLLNTIQSSSISTFFYFCKFQLDPRRGTNFKIEIKTEFPCKGDTEFSIRSTFSQTYKKKHFFILFAVASYNKWQCWKIINLNQNLGFLHVSNTLGLFDLNITNKLNNWLMKKMCFICGWTFPLFHFGKGVG